jgi:hypothetical protein
MTMTDFEQMTPEERLEAYTKLRSEFTDRISQMREIANQAVQNWSLVASSASLFEKVADKLSLDELMEMNGLLLDLNEAILPKDSASAVPRAQAFLAKMQQIMEAYTIPRV